MLEAVRTKAPEVVVWGSGSATREFLYVDDAARAIVSAVDVDVTGDFPWILNIVGGMRNQISNTHLANEIAGLVGFTGALTFDAQKPTGQPRRSFSGVCALHALQWGPKMRLSDGLATTVAWIKEQQ